MLLLNKTRTSLTQQRGHVTVTSSKCQMVAKRANLQERCRRRENRSGFYDTRKISAMVAPRVRNAAGASGSGACSHVVESYLQPASDAQGGFICRFMLAFSDNDTRLLSFFMIMVCQEHHWNRKIL